MRTTLYRIQGFTLIELLAVIALMAVVAVVAVMSYEDVDDQAQADVTKYEMAELRKALLQFRRDTGVFPRTGSYSCRDPGDLANPNKSNPDMVFPSQLTSESLQVSWCERPENLWHLIKCPFDPDSAACKWDPDTKRGWHGPYISGQWGYVDVNDASTADERLIPALADKFPSSLYEWHACSDAHGATPPDDPACDGYRNKGQPYLLIVDEDPLSLDSMYPRIVSSGRNGVYGGGNSTDDKMCLPNQSDQSGKDDLVLCLSK